MHRLRRSNPPLRRRRGSAMVLVILAAAVAAVLGVTFLSRSATLTGTAQTLTDHAQARQLAEAGLEMTIRYVKETPDWRLQQENGTWFEDFQMDGGSIDVTGAFTDDREEPLTLTATAYYNDASHLVTADLLSKHKPIPLAVDGKIELSNKAFIDSFDSSEGPYGSGDSEDALIATNTTSTNGVDLRNSSQIYGDVFVGVDGDPDTVVSDTDKVTGEVDTLPTAMDFPDPATMPDDVGSNLGDKTVTGNYTIDSSRHFDDFEIASSGVVTVTGGDFTVRVNEDFNVTNMAELVIEEGSSLRIYVGEDILISNEAQLNVASGDPTRLVLFGVGQDYEYMIQNQARFYGIIDAPASTLKVQNSAEMFGAAMVQRLEAQNEISGVYLDRNPALIEANPRLPSVVGSNLGYFAVTRWSAP